MTAYAMTIEDMLALLPEDLEDKCWAVYVLNRDRFDSAWGSTHNHQAWEGGYNDHIRAVMNIAIKLYDALESMTRASPLPFHLWEALLVLYLHDLEKPWRLKELHPDWTKKQNKEFREQKIVEAGIVLTPEQQNALTYVEGEGADYSSKHRVMNELAAFCHLCDVTSARIFHSK